MGKMTCDQCRRWWSPYLDSELDASKTFEVSEHLRVCESCQSRFESEKDMDGWMRDTLRDVQMPASLWSEIQAGVSRPKRLRIAGWFKPLVLAASVVFMVSAGVFLWERPLDLVVTAQSSMVELLEKASPELTVFSALSAGQDSVADLKEQLAADSRRLLGVQVEFEMPQGNPHGVKLIGVHERTDAVGNTYVELRLNCCGKPTLIALGKSGLPSSIAELHTEMVTPKTKRSTLAGGEIPIEVQSKIINGVMVAGATADHHLSAVFSGIKVTKV